MAVQSFENIELELAILYRRITSITNHKKFGNLDRSAYLILYQIITHGASGVKALADEFHLDISTISRQAAALEHKGYVYKIPDPTDGRAYSFQITELGTKEYQDYKISRLKKVREVLGDWPEEDREVFGRLLKKFNRSVLENEHTK